MGEYGSAMKHIEIALNGDGYHSGGWTYLYQALVNYAIGNDDKAEQGLLEAAASLTDDVDACSSLLEMKKNDNRENQCYDGLLELLSSSK